MSVGTNVLAVRQLRKTFRIGFFRKRIEAVRGVDFEVKQGEIFGLLGPNGAGKTTTIKMIVRLIFPTAGTIELFGKPAGDRRAMQRIGFLPENPYVYQYLKPLEFLDLCGRLVGLDGPTRRKRSGELLEQVGLTGAVDRPIGRFSKGMTQRIGLAQALLHDPEVLILDEPMSGLDPVGRKEVRDLIVSEKKKGKTLLFSSHILTDAEMLCDRVSILRKGVTVAYGRLDELLRRDVRRVEIVLEGANEELRGELSALLGVKPESASSEPPGAFRAQIVVHGSETTLVAEGETAVPEILRIALAKGARVVSVTPHRESLEDLFMRKAVLGTDDHGVAAS
jgi:ABC-2 type transport system ATP-binding protein